MPNLWPTRSAKLHALEKGLRDFSQHEKALKGIAQDAALKTLAMQMVSSLRRLDHTDIIKRRDIHPDRANPSSPLFDPEKAAFIHARNGEYDEAIWLVFLSIHFGKHRKFGWRLARDIYSGLGQGVWTWKRVANDPDSFRQWLGSNQSKIGGAFGNHRKYETLDVNSRASTAAVIRSFVDIFTPSPANYFASLARSVGNDPTKIFESAYRELKVLRFGRLAKFDFLSLLGRMDLAPLRPGSAYLKGATGPLRGARLLIDGKIDSSTNAEELDATLRKLDETLHVGMQVMEDSICNWQKSPRKFIHFRG